MPEAAPNGAREAGIVTMKKAPVQEEIEEEAEREAEREHQDFCASNGIYAQERADKIAESV